MVTGRKLNEKYKLGAKHARYRENGVWFHPLKRFPGALCDKNGFVMFETEQQYMACDGVKKGPDPNHIHVRGGIASLPGYTTYPS